MLRDFKICQEAVAALSTETIFRLARRWQERNGWPPAVGLEQATARALWDIIRGRHVLESIRDEVEEALESAKVALAMEEP